MSLSGLSGRRKGTTPSLAGSLPGSALGTPLLVNGPLVPTPMEMSFIAPRITFTEDDLPEDCRGKQLSYADNGTIGMGSSGVVCRIDVDRDSSSYVGKYARNIGNDQDALAEEIQINRELREAGLANHPNLCVAAGFASIGDRDSMLMELISGASLSDHFRDLHRDLMSKKIEPGKMVDFVKELTHGIATGLAAMHEHGFVMNDLNVGNVRTRLGIKDNIPAAIPVIHDFGCTGKVGSHKKPGMLEITPPERLRARDTHDESDTHNEPLTAKTDAYSLGSLLFYMVHRRYCTWVDLAAGQQGSHDQDDARRFALEGGVAKFMENKTIFPGGYPVNENLREREGTDKQEREKAFRKELDNAGFYNLIEQLMRPSTEQRLSITEALASHRFLNPTTNTAE